MKGNILATTPQNTNLRKPPGPKHRFLGANGSYLFFTNIGKYLGEKKKKYGDFVLLKASGHPIYLINNIEYVEQILIKNHKNFSKGIGYQRAKVILGNGILTSHGEFHDSQRKMINPAFHRSKIEEYYSIVRKCTSKMMEDWDNKISSNAILDIQSEMTRLFISIILNSLFPDDTTEDLLETGFEYTELFQNANPLFLLNPEKAMKVPIPFIKRFVKAKSKLDFLIQERIKQQNGELLKDKFDLMNLIMNSLDSNGNKMTDEALFDEVRTLFAAANDTSSKVMTWAIYELSQNTSVRNNLEKEIKSVLNNNFPVYKDFENLNYAKMVLNETMRLYPPVWMMPRTPLNDFYLDNYLIKKDSSIFITPFFIHRDEKYFENPEKFEPDRWTDEQKKKRPKLSFFPFGAGPRVCVGEAFAMFHMVIILSALFQKYNFTLAPGQKVKISTTLTLKPKYGMNMLLEKKL